MPAPVWGLELGSVRHSAHGRRGRRAAKSRSGRPDTGWAVSLGTPEPVGYGATACETSPATPSGPWAPPGHLPGGGRAARRG